MLKAKIVLHKSKLTPALLRIIKSLRKIFAFATSILIISECATAYAGTNFTNLSWFITPIELIRPIQSDLLKLKYALNEQRWFQPEARTLMRRIYDYSEQARVIDSVFSSGNELPQLTNAAVFNNYEYANRYATLLIDKYKAAAGSAVLTGELPRVNLILHGILFKAKNKEPFSKEVDELGKIVEIIRRAKAASQQVLSDEELKKLLEMAYENRYNEAKFIVEQSLDRFHKVGAVVFVGSMVLEE